MEIKTTCNCCGNTTTRQIKVGDTIELGDGSGMPNGLHHVLWNGVGSNPPFKPVRVVRVEGNTLAVIPLHWGNREFAHKEKFDDKVYPALSWLLDSRDIFWVYAPHCQPVKEA